MVMFQQNQFKWFYCVIPFHLKEISLHRNVSCLSANRQLRRIHKRADDSEEFKWSYWCKYVSTATVAAVTGLLVCPAAVKLCPSDHHLPSNYQGDLQDGVSNPLRIFCGYILHYFLNLIIMYTFHLTLFLRFHYS